MLPFLLQALGRTIAHLPDPVRQALATGGGFLGWHLLRGRRQIVLRNLHHFFPEKQEKERRALARTHFDRLLEMGLLGLALPFLPEPEIRSRFRLDDPSEHGPFPDGVLALTPHTTLLEAVTTIGLHRTYLDGASVLFRPLDNPALDQFIRASRERFGMKLVSRRKGFTEAMAELRRGRCVALLFDQNAGKTGTLVFFGGRLAWATDLPNLLGQKFRPAVILYVLERDDFWRGRFIEQKLEGPDYLAAANTWLENYLRREDGRTADWLWSHSRWKTQDQPKTRFRIEARRTRLPEMPWPKRTRFFVRLPNWLGDVVMAAPLLRALAENRPDAELTLLGKPAFQPLCERLGLGDRYLGLPTSEAASWGFFRQLRTDYPDTFVLLTNSLRGDGEAWLTRCPQRFGLIRRGKPRPLLTHGWTVPPDLDLRTVHQTELWRRFFAHFGLPGELDRTPFGYSEEKDPVLGVIAGTENFPAKRWPLAHWIDLLGCLLAWDGTIQVRLFGTVRDRAVTGEIATALASDRVTDRAGRTDLAAYMNELGRCRVVVCNDTGGMHLANALGVPVVALFGPTNPVRTGPCFEAEATILQPPGCPPTGGKPLAELTPAMVLAAVEPKLGKAD